VGTPDSLIQPLRLHLARVQAQELAKLIGRGNLDQIVQVWFEDNLAQTTQVRSGNEILTEIRKTGIVPDDELKTLVENTPTRVVRDAVEALKEALEERRANKPLKFLKAAIRRKFKPNSRKKEPLKFIK
jgi:predicted Zn-dependent protease